jgi:hypothetical protein
MEQLQHRIRIAVLWIFMAVAMSAHSVLAFMEKEMVEEFWAMEMGPGMMLFMAIFWLVPLIMAFLSVTLKDSANRLVNIILGAIFTILNIFHLVEHIANPSLHQIMIIGSTVIVTLLVFIYALKWPKQG